jgi:AraC-like DNA-binding protein
MPPTIQFGRPSIALLIGVVQGLALAVALLRAPRNRTANRFLAGLILAVSVMITPYILGFAGFYDVYPWLIFAPFQTSLAIGPLLYFYVLALTGGPLPANWRLHFAPYGVQFLTQAIMFPFPVATKYWWYDVAHDPIVSPITTALALTFLAVYGHAAWKRYRDYRAFLTTAYADGMAFEAPWIRNFLIALGLVTLVWAGHFAANRLDASRDYIDQLWMYLGLAALIVYLGVEGWRNSALTYPVLAPSPAPAADPLAEAAPERDWAAQGALWAAEVDRLGLCRDPEVSLASVARALGTNTAYLSRALNEGLGMSFSKFVNQRRVEAVKRRLEDETDARDLMTIALEAGFNSKASFNRAFGEIAGMTPSAFRRSRRKQP